MKSLLEFALYFLGGIGFGHCTRFARNAWLDHKRLKQKPLPVEYDVARYTCKECGGTYYGHYQTCSKYGGQKP